MDETLTRNIDLIESLLKYKYKIKGHEVEKAIKTIQVIHALKTPCTIKDLERLTGRKRHTVLNILKSLSPLLDKKTFGGSQSKKYQLLAYKGIE